MFGQSPSPSFSVRPHPSQEALTLSAGFAAAGVEAGTATYNCRIFLTNSHFYIIYIYKAFIYFYYVEYHLHIAAKASLDQHCFGNSARLFGSPWQETKSQKIPVLDCDFVASLHQKKSLLLPLFCQQAQTACTLYTHNKFKKPRITAPNHNP